MSLIIKGSIMPLMCEECPCYDCDDYSCKATGRGVIEYRYDGRPDNCPPVEIPTPHGRLIDADRLFSMIHGTLCETCETFSCEKGKGCLIDDVFNLIDQAPTIIEAEVSE